MFRGLFRQFLRQIVRLESIDEFVLPIDRQNNRVCSPVLGLDNVFLLQIFLQESRCLFPRSFLESVLFKSAWEIWI